jgi:hypothetical protein
VQTLVNLRDTVQRRDGRRAGAAVERRFFGRSGIHVVACLTELPPPPHEVLHERFHKARAIARAWVE